MSSTRKPAKTWDHLADRRRRPNEYEIVSTNLHWRTAFPNYSELDPGIPMNRWYRKYQRESPLLHDDWDAFRDADRVTYRSYNVMQDGQEAYVDGLLSEHDELGYDLELSSEWLDILARLYTPGRYLLHTVQMASAYLFSMAPASTISNCVGFQMGDALRWVSRTAYRTRELANHHPAKGFADNERERWEEDAAWQGFRELMERLLVTYEWGETLIALNVVAKPAIDEAFLRQFAATARRQGDSLLGLLADAQLLDSNRSRRWTGEFVEFALANNSNKKIIEEWVSKWTPLAERAMEAFCEALPDSADAGQQACRATRAFRQDLGITV